MSEIGYKYNEIAETIKNRILNGLYTADTPIPPENTLASEFQVSRITIRNALQSLIEEGYLYSVPGKGNYAMAKTNDKFIVSIRPENLLKNSYDTAVLLGSEIINPTIELVYHLRIAPDARIVKIDWLLSKHDTPVIYDTQFIPYFPGITLWTDNFEYTSFSQTVSQKNGIFDTNEHIQFNAIPCEAEAAHRLKIEKDAPVMVVTQKIFENDDPLAMRKLYIHSTHCRISGVSCIL